MMEHKLDNVKQTAQVVLGTTLLIVVLVLLSSCGPAGGASERAAAESSASESTRSLLGESESSGTDVLPSPAAQQGAADEIDTEANSAAELDTTIAFVDESAEYDEAGLQVGFTEDGHPYRGNPDAPVVIQEYSDYQCPYCSRFYLQTLPSLLENQIATGEAVLIYYDFPLTNIHPYAAAAANAARCAGEQGAAAYWAMHDRLFTDPAEWSVDGVESVFLSYAQELNLEADEFEACAAEDRYAPEIQVDLASGANLSVNGTPSFFINGQMLVGAQPLDNFVSAIETVKNGGQLASNEPQAQQAPAVAPTPAVFSDDFAGAMGDPDAPVTIVEFTDYQCPYCSQHSLQTLPGIVSEFIDTGRVQYILKDLPLDQLHPDARAAAEVARCAGEQGDYWQMHDEIFANQAEWAGQSEAATEILVGLAADLGLDESEMTACLESGRFAGDIEANVAEARSLGIGGTPMFFVDGYPISGARPFELFELAVQYAEEGILAEAYAPADSQPEEPSGPPEQANVEIGDAIVLGDPDAPVTIFEFTDFQCPYCVRHFQQTYPRILEEYVDTGIVRYVFKDFPLNSIHPQAAEAAQAARCAKEQDAFLEMHDALFQQQQLWSGQTPTALFVGMAEDIGLDADAFEQCLTSGKYEDAVNADLNQGIELGITGTPAFFINGYLLSGAQPFELFQQAIQAMLDEQQG